MGIEITNLETFGWTGAIRGMRNSFGSWDKSDSEMLPQASCSGNEEFFIGPNDLELATRLSKLGGSHSKFRRMIHVQCDICAPLFWWKQYDTYKIGTVANSTSTMHSIMKKKFTGDDFSKNNVMSMEFGLQLLSTIETLNTIREKYLKEEDLRTKKMYFDDVTHLLPDCYNQLRTVDLNYEVIARMVNDRLYHKLDEWQEFCRKMLANLPYARELILDIQVEKDKEKDGTE